jgi:long-subunit acyl-CoA synthetase (AMP-forming)
MGFQARSGNVTYSIAATRDARSVCELFQTVSAQRPVDVVALRSLDGSTEITWGELRRRIPVLAGGMHSLGVRRGGTVVTMLSNRPEFYLVDLAAMHLGATAFSVYNTLPVDQLAHVLSNSDATVMVTEPQFVDRVMAARPPALEHIVVVEESGGLTTLADLEKVVDDTFDFEACWRAVQPDDVVTLVYTSGTTGPPKGVELQHSTILFSVNAMQTAMPHESGGRGVSFLPAAHLTERLACLYYNLVGLGGTITSVADATKLGEALPKIRPTMFISVPRMLEKIHASLQASGIDPRVLDAQSKKAVLARLGLDALPQIISGGAPLATEVIEFFMEFDLPVLEAWGMSEGGVTTFVNPRHAPRPGTVGVMVPGVEMRVLDDGELLVRGPMMKGYRKEPTLTAEAIDAEGWLHTGDIVTVDDDGYVSIVDRKKEIIINSAGKNMSPLNIERQLKIASPLIGQAVCIGDRRSYNVALLVLDPEAASAWASKRGLDPSIESLSQNDELQSELAEAVSRANENMARVEQIKKFKVMPSEWLPASDELTPTGKLKRKPINLKYADVIESLYNS